MNELNRRQIIRGTVGGLMLAWSGKAPAQITRDARRPTLQQGVATGDLSTRGTLVWSRADRPSKMHVSWSTHSDHRAPYRVVGPDALSVRDYTAVLGLVDLPPNRDIFYRIRFEDLSTGALSAPVNGRFHTPCPQGNRTIKFAWSGDIGGQGFGINPTIGGMKIFDAIASANPDFFLNCGDVVYADAPLRARKTIGPNKVWHNLVIPEKMKVAETTDEFRAQFKYNLLDQHLRTLNAQVPTTFLWDDHETKNNWWPGRILSDRRYTERRCDLLAARAKNAFFEFCPIARNHEQPGRIYRHLPYGSLLDVFTLDSRSYRSPNSRNRQDQIGSQTHFFGPAQSSWLCASLKKSRAVWKVIVCPQPIGLQIAHGGTDYDGISNGLMGRPRGREKEFARILSFIREHKIKNIVWVTADVHYAAAHHYSPQRSRFKDFDPFWEFLAGPLNAGTFGPNPLDPTFGPKVEFLSIPNNLRPGRSPLSGMQFFGTGEIDPQNKRFTVSLHDLTGRILWSTQLDAHPS